MNSFYIFGYQFEESLDGTQKQVSVTVIFCSCDEIDEGDLQNEIKAYYEEHYQTDLIFIIGSNKIEALLHKVFIDRLDITFKGIPKRHATAFNESVNLLSFGKDGNLRHIHGQYDLTIFRETYLKEGLIQIFKSRGGLIVSESSHHYVFPSGKHCDRFLRTGNILLYSPEVFFIAFALLKHFDESKYSRIYCDTSSINSIAFALFSLKNSFLDSPLNVSIESFSSYEGLYSNSQQYTKDSFLLISASTSTNIIKYILDKQTVIERDNILVLYYLSGGSTDYANVKDQVLCDLTKSQTNSNGIEPYRTYLKHECKLCKEGSYPVPVSGDVFLLEAPKINKILLARTDRDPNLSRFMNQFKSVRKGQTVLKAHYKERLTDKYEVYIDFTQIIRHIRTGKHCQDFKNKLDHYIQQYLPANTRYLLHLMDEGSKELANYIFEEISPNYRAEHCPIVLDQDHLESMDQSNPGAVVVIGSCISNGKNLLYISRALRQYENLRIIYFVGIIRTNSSAYTTTLASNLKMGRYGADTHSFVSVETMYCNNNAKLTPWIAEIEFLKDIIQFIKTGTESYPNALTYFEERKTMLNQAAGDQLRGLSQQLFFPRITITPHEQLQLQKGFAFWDFSKYMDDVVQSDTFFTISNILNTLRNSTKPDRQLKQAVYSRNLLDPANFNRFNDGIIQASLLRAAKTEELAYAMDYEISQEMFNILETIIKYHGQQQGEALLEFLYAIATKKMTLNESHLRNVLLLVEQKCSHEFFRCMALFIQKKLIDEPEELRRRPIGPPPSSFIGQNSEDKEEKLSESDHKVGV